jgi:excisionase family DNA binding protein
VSSEKWGNWRERKNLMERLYSIKEAAEMLRLSPWTLWSWMKKGKLRGSKIGDRRVIRESELLRLIVDDPKPATVKAAPARV